MSPSESGNAATGYGRRDSLACWLCNLILNHIAGSKYRKMVGGSIRYGLLAAARDGGSKASGVAFNEEGWWVLRAPGELGGRVIVDATEEMTPGQIDLSITSNKGPSAAAAITRDDALALADELKRVGGR